MTPPKVELRRVSKTFIGEGERVEALKDLSFEVRPQEFLTVVGPSGSGKSTIFNLIVGLLEPDEGEILIDGRAVPSRLGQFGYMPQRDLLLPWRTVLDNVIVAQELRGAPSHLARSMAREMLPMFGLESFADSYPDVLSGGMRQRAALLRTVLTEHDVLLLDEPFGALDALTRRELQDWLQGIWRQFRRTIVFITHDVEEALYLGDRVLVLSARPGRVVRELIVPLPRPRHPRMLAQPEFGATVAELLEALGVLNK
jgi:ABC-type nitrate/sulfonate/bicarbonate transport system ATPase subunit